MKQPEQFVEKKSTVIPPMQRHQRSTQSSLLLQLRNERFNLPTPCLFRHLRLESSEIRKVSFLFPSLDFLGPSGLGPLCVNIIGCVLFPDRSSASTVGDFHCDVRDV